MDSNKVLETVLNIREDFEKKAAAVRADRRLTQFGKDDALRTLTAEKEAALKGLIVPLRHQAVLDALEVRRLNHIKGTLKSLEAESMDFERLTYEAGRVRSILALCNNDPLKIAEKFKAAKETRDRFFIRAWIDEAPQHFPDSTNGNLAWMALKEDMEKSLGAADSTEMSSYERQRLEHVASLDDIKRTALVIAGEFGREAQFKGQAVVDRIFNGFAPDDETGEFTCQIEQSPTESAEGVFMRTEVEHNLRVDQQAQFFKERGLEFDELTDFTG
jgi:hypothetical protein